MLKRQNQDDHDPGRVSLQLLWLPQRPQPPRPISAHAASWIFFVFCPFLFRFPWWQGVCVGLGPRLRADGAPASGRDGSRRARAGVQILHVLVEDILLELPVPASGAVRKQDRGGGAGWILAALFRFVACLERGAKVAAGKRLHLSPVIFSESGRDVLL